MYSACKTQPRASSGERVDVSRAAFNLTPVSESSTIASTSSSYSTSSTIALPSPTNSGTNDPSPSASPSATSDRQPQVAVDTSSTSSIPSARASGSAHPDSPGLSTTASAGIGVAAGLLTLAIGGALLFLLSRRRRQNRSAPIYPTPPKGVDPSYPSTSSTHFSREAITVGPQWHEVDDQHLVYNANKVELDGRNPMPELTGQGRYTGELDGTPTVWRR